MDKSNNIDLEFFNQIKFNIETLTKELEIFIPEIKNEIFDFLKK